MRKIMAALLISTALITGGCLVNKNENLSEQKTVITSVEKNDKGIGVTLKRVNDNNTVEVSSSKSFSLAEINLNGQYSQNDIMMPDFIVPIISKCENTKIILISKQKDIPENTVIFRIKSSSSVNIELTNNYTSQEIDAEAALQKSTKRAVVTGDLNNDSKVDILDFLIIANKYGTYDATCDLNKDGKFDIKDFVIFTKAFYDQNVNATTTTTSGAVTTGSVITTGSTVTTGGTVTPVQNTFKVECTVGSDWGSGFGADFKITNLTNTEIKDWTLEFDWTKNIDSIWNATKTKTANHYVIKNVGWNMIIPAGGSVSFGINGSTGNVGTNKPTNYTLKYNGTTSQSNTNTGTTTSGTITTGSTVTTGITITTGTTITTGGTVTPSTGGKKVVAYYPEWGAYSGHNTYAPADMPWDKVTHINYAFATIKNGEIAVFDDWAATGIAFGEAWDSQYKGCLGQFKKLSRLHPNTNTMISIGGWSQSMNFHFVALDDAARTKFAASVVKFVRDWEFDGVDIDWEYPTFKREGDIIDNPNDQGTPYADAAEKHNFTLLLKALREALTKAGAEDKKYYQLTAAVGAGIDKIEQTEPDQYSKYLDFINLMTYDMHGAWENMTGHQSPMFANPKAPYDDMIKNQYTVDAAMKNFEKYGIAKDKLIVGSPYYTRGWKGVENNGPIPELPGLFATATGGANGIWDGGRAAGCNPFYYVKNTLEKDMTFKKYRDPYTKTPYLYSATKKEFYTYEDEYSLKYKVDYVNSNNYGGVIFWEITGDSPSKGTTLTDILYRGLIKKETFTIADDVAAVTISGGIISGTTTASGTTTTGTTSTTTPSGMQVSTLSKVGDYKILTDAEITAEFGAINKNYSATEISTKMKAFLPQADYEALFPNRYGTAQWSVTSGKTDTEYYKYSDFIDAAVDLADIVIKVETRDYTQRVTRLQKSTKKETLLREDADYNADWLKNKIPVVEIADYANFIVQGTETQKKQELAALLANMSHETTGGWDTAPGGRYAWGLYFKEEVGMNDSSVGGYVDAGNKEYPPVSGKSYHGRGPIQLSWNYNYGYMSQIIYGDKNILLYNPEKVSHEGKLGFMTALWFWMTPQSPKPSCHDVMVGNWKPNSADISAGRLPGFGMTIVIINGALEAGILNDYRVKDRIGFYEAITTRMAIPTGDNISCERMKAY